MPLTTPHSGPALTPTLLLLEDEPGDQELFQIAAATGRCPVLLQCAADGAEAVQYLETLPVSEEPLCSTLPDLIVVDLMMPRMDGLEFLRWLRSSPIYGSLPAVAYSATFDERLVASARALGAAEVFLKPCGFKLWTSMVLRICERARWLALGPTMPGALRAA